MASNKSKNEQTNTVAYATPPPTAATTALQGMVDKGADFSTPIRNSYARAEQNLSHSYQNPLGAFTTADVRDKSLRAQHNDLQQNMGLDLSNAAQENAQGQFNRQATVAGLTAPQMYNSGGTSASKWTGADTLGLGLNAAQGALT